MIQKHSEVDAKQLDGLLISRQYAGKCFALGVPFSGSRLQMIRRTGSHWWGLPAPTAKAACEGKKKKSGEEAALVTNSLTPEIRDSFCTRVFPLRRCLSCQRDILLLLQRTCAEARDGTEVYFQDQKRSGRSDGLETSFSTRTRLIY